MSFSTVLSASIQGLEVEFVSVEADVSNGLPSFHMVGYLSSEVREAAERVRTAILNSSLDFPAKKMVINLSPATVRKRGSAFDLPIALAILMSLGKVKKEGMDQMLFLGELGLDGSVQPVPGVLPMVLHARDAGICRCVVSKKNAAEAALVDGIEIVGVENLQEVLSYLANPMQFAGSKEERDRRVTQAVYTEDFAEIQGQGFVKRATEVAVAGAHNLLLIGPPGSGKSMMAKRIPTIFPPMTLKESIDVTKIYSIVGELDAQEPLITKRPFYNVHHTTTKTALVGGGVIPRPGMLSLSHHGVLYLDEVAEFQKPVLESLRQPLEDRKIRIARSTGTYEYPANVMLVCAMNPCPCGCYPDLERCTCTPSQIKQYLGKISQPFLDRMDICVEAPKVAYEELKGSKEQESSAQIRERVCRAREIQNKRYQGTDIQSNAMLGVKEIQTFCMLGEAEEKLMQQAFVKLSLTARTYHKILKVARTIADLEGSEQICLSHIKEAIGYRTMDKKYWGR
jgi:magnesium chelatase family protein